MIDSFLLDLIKNNHDDVVYKVSASELYLSFKIYCSNNNIEIISEKKIGIIMKTYERIYYHRHVKRYYSIIIPNLKEDLNKISM